MMVSDFDYDLPEEAIAQEAIEPRDAARLLVAATLGDRTMRDLHDLLDAGDLLVVNETRVRAARLQAMKSTGGTVEVLLTRRNPDDTWEALLRPARRIRSGTELTAGPITITVASEAVDGVATVTMAADEDPDDLLPTVGRIPLPPYFHGELADDERYQTMFAKTVGSAAAPTAALHFTPRLIDSLTERGVSLATIDLEVGLDTFRPMSDGLVENHNIHTERFRVPQETAHAVNETRASGCRVIAVGTTVVRSLETVVDDNGVVRAHEGDTCLFILPGHRFRAVDAVLTNFHAPRTTLIAMAAAMLGARWRRVYAHALDGGYRFLSFGDAMYVEVDR